MTSTPFDTVELMPRFGHQVVLAKHSGTFIAYPDGDPDEAESADRLTSLTLEGLVTALERRVASQARATAHKIDQPVWVVYEKAREGYAYTRGAFRGHHGGDGLPRVYITGDKGTEVEVASSHAARHDTTVSVRYVFPIRKPEGEVSDLVDTLGDIARLKVLVDELAGSRVRGNPRPAEGELVPPVYWPLYRGRHSSGDIQRANHHVEVFLADDPSTVPGIVV